MPGIVRSASIVIQISVSFVGKGMKHLCKETVSVSQHLAVFLIVVLAFQDLEELLV
jgi:hypothetical protein